MAPLLGTWSVKVSSFWPSVKHPIAANFRTKDCYYDWFYFHHTDLALSPSILFVDEPPEEEEEEDGDSSETQDVIRVDTELVAEQHSNTTVFCNHEHDNTVHNVTLERMPHDQQPWGVIGVCSRIKGGPVAQSYSDRGRLTCTDALNVRLQLTGVQQQDAGLYRCTWSTDGALQNTTVLLRVQPTDTEAGEIISVTYESYEQTARNVMRKNVNVM